MAVSQRQTALMLLSPAVASILLSAENAIWRISPSARKRTVPKRAIAPAGSGSPKWSVRGPAATAPGGGGVSGPTGRGFGHTAAPTPTPNPTTANAAITVPIIPPGIRRRQSRPRHRRHSTVGIASLGVANNPPARTAGTVRPRATRRFRSNSRPRSSRAFDVSIVHPNP